MIVVGLTGKDGGQLAALRRGSPCPVVRLCRPHPGGAHPVHPRLHRPHRGALRLSSGPLAGSTECRPAGRQRSTCDRRSPGRPGHPLPDGGAARQCCSGEPTTHQERHRAPRLPLAGQGHHDQPCAGRPAQGGRRLRLASRLGHPPQPPNKSISLHWTGCCAWVNWPSTGRFAPDSAAALALAQIGTDDRFDGIVLPTDSAAEAALLPAVSVHPAAHLGGRPDHLSVRFPIPRLQRDLAALVDVHTERRTRTPWPQSEAKIRDRSHGRGCGRRTQCLHGRPTRCR